MSAPGATRRVTGGVARRPAVAAALALMGGILARDLLPAKPIIWLVATALLLGLGAWRLRDDLFCGACLAGAIFLTGAASAQLEFYFFAHQQIGLFTAPQPELANLEMRIVEPPRVISGESEMRKLPPKQTAVADMLAVETLTGWQKAGGRISVSLEPPLDALAAGQTIRALGFLERPPEP